MIKSVYRDRSVCSTTDLSTPLVVDAGLKKLRFKVIALSVQQIYNVDLKPFCITVEIYNFHNI